MNSEWEFVSNNRNKPLSLKAIDSPEFWRTKVDGRLGNKALAVVLINIEGSVKIE